MRLPKDALTRLRKSDPGLRRIMDRVPFDMRIASADNDLEALVRSIVGQQLSGKAAATIFGRFRALYDADAFPDAERILRTRPATLRGAGLSQAKSVAVHDLCTHVAEGRLPLDSPGLRKLPDEDLITRLSEVRGIGRWSAQMFLMFHLGRRDVWPTGDLGIQKGAQLVFGLKALPTPKQLEPMGEPFAPLRSVAAWYLWRSLE